MVCWVLRPSSFSSRLIRVAAADKPMTAAKIGSPTLEMRWAGEGILKGESLKCPGGRSLFNVNFKKLCCEDWGSAAPPESPNFKLRTSETKKRHWIFNVPTRVDHFRPSDYPWGSGTIKHILLPMSNSSRDNEWVPLFCPLGTPKHITWSPRRNLVLKQGLFESSLFKFQDLATASYVQRRRYYIPLIHANANFPPRPLNFSSYVQFFIWSHAALEKAMSKAGIRVCASQKEKTSLGPVIRSLERVSMWLRMRIRGTYFRY